jgi:hypothetical protein
MMATVLLAVTAAVLLTGSIFYTEQATMPHSQDVVSVYHGQRCDQYFQPVDLSSACIHTTITSCVLNRTPVLLQHQRDRAKGQSGSLTATM